MNRKKMKEVADAYERIQHIEQDIKIIKLTAEKILDSSSPSWISIDLEDDILKEMEQSTWTTTTASGAFFVSPQTKQEDEGFTIDVPDTIALEILGVILRYKQQLIENESNNI